MSAFRRTVLRLLSFFRATRAEDDLAREIRAHLALVEDEYRRLGMTSDEARLAARNAIGGVEQAKELQREARSFVWLEDLRQDLRHTLRALRRTPGFATVAVLTLALGIGANTAIFSVINALLLRPLPYDGSDRLVRITEHLGALDSVGLPQAPRTSIQRSELDALRSARTLSHIGVYSGRPLSMTLGGRAEPIRLGGEQVSAEIFPMLRARPALGRTFDVRDEPSGADAVVILSHAAWQRYFDGSSSILGQIVSLDGKGHSVIGVMPQGFEFPNPQAEFWIPFVWPARGGNGSSIARVKDGVSMDAARADVGALLNRLRGPRTDTRALGRPRFELLRIQDELVDPVRPALRVLAAAVGVVLLIACVNVTSLLLARTTAHQREVAVRLALGARRGRVIRQALTESVALALAGGVVGTALSWGGVQLVRTLGASLPRRDLYLGSGIGIPRLDEIGLDASVLLFTLAVSGLTGIVFGLAPAIRQSRSDYVGRLRDGATAPIAGFGLTRGNRLQGLLIVAEIAMAMVLLAGGGLLIHGFIKLSNVDPGYDPTNVVWFQTFPPRERSAPELATFAEALVERMRSVPAVRAVGYAPQLPTGNALRDTSLRPGPEPPAPGQIYPRVDLRVVSHDFLKTLGVRLVAGRGLTADDRAGRPLVMVVNQSVVRSGVLGDRPIGTRVYSAGPASWEIVGIVEDMHQFGLDREPGSQAFVDFRQLPGPGFNGLYVVVRTDEGTTSVATSMRGIVRQLDAQATVDTVATMEQLLANTISRPRLYAVLLGIFAGVAVVLAAIGIYGVMAYAVTQSTREIGIRMALGAGRNQVLGLVLRQGLAVSGIGIALGLGGAMAVTGYLQGMLFGLTPLDPPTFIAVALLFAGVATLASYVPARRATRVDPLVALRYE